MQWLHEDKQEDNIHGPWDCNHREQSQVAFDCNVRVLQVQDDSLHNEKQLSEKRVNAKKKKLLEATCS